MRELSVYYCPKCGRYGYYHLSKNAVCSECSVPMALLNINYQSFMNMDYSMRDQLIADQIVGEIVPKSSVVQRLAAYAQTSCTRMDAARFRTAIEQLEKENQALADEKRVLQKKNEELEQTVGWMHELIWELIRKQEKK